ncbi:MAG: tyrosine-type recombinase/integrase [Proteobacteria bacterium]|nr:tyrosine-type recombinase/integrase [Pseudomonadota bacterium]
MKAKLSSRTLQSLQPCDKPFEVVDSELKGFLLRVQPSGAKTYYFSYRNSQGRRGRYRIGNGDALSPAQARDQAVLLSARVVAGEDIQSQKKHERLLAEQAKSRTLDGFLIHQYEPWVTSQRKSGADTVKRLRSNFAHLMQRPLVDINLWVIEKWRSEELKRGKAKTTINRDITTLKACLSKAVEWELLDANPLQKLKPIRTDALTRARYLNATEESVLRNALIERDQRLRKNRASGNAWRRARHHEELPDLSSVAFADYLQPMVLLSLNTGLRRGEILQLRWADVDLLRRELIVRGDNAKSGKTRHIPLNHEALTTLQQWRSESRSTEWVFVGKDGKRMWAVKASWKRVLLSAAIVDFRWHDLRHHFASRLVMNGVDLNTVRELLGHADLTMTLRYAHLSPEHKADAVARLCRSDEHEVELPAEIAAQR